ncbi:MAG: chemotaxis protein CheR [Nitrospirales bacterium]|nr:chemotaxis protein CheR [Nitrospirales bacterium]
MAFTFFFRDSHTLEHAVRHVVPYASGRSKIRIWDAGAAMGQEAYTLAIMLSEAMNPFGFMNLKIHTTDIEENFGPIIQEGVYHESELQRIPSVLFEKYFKSNGNPGRYQIVDLIRDRVAHQRHDLLSLQPIGEGFCLIVCKNVLLHFQQAERIAVIRMFHSALASGGYFVSEQTQKMPDEVLHLFEQVVPDAQLYKKKET